MKTLTPRPAPLQAFRRLHCQANAAKFNLARCGTFSSSISYSASVLSEALLCLLYLMAPHTQLIVRSDEINDSTQETPPQAAHACIDSCGNPHAFTRGSIFFLSHPCDVFSLTSSHPSSGVDSHRSRDRSLGSSDVGGGKRQVLTGKHSLLPLTRDLVDNGPSRCPLRRH